MKRIPFQETRAEQLDFSAHEKSEMPSVLAGPADCAHQYPAAGQAFTGFRLEALAGIAGHLTPWKGIAQAWALFSTTVEKGPFQLIWAIDRGLLMEGRALQLRKRPAPVRVRHHLAQRRVEPLAVFSEGNMPGCGPPWFRQARF